MIFLKGDLIRRVSNPFDGCPIGTEARVTDSTVRDKCLRVVRTTEEPWRLDYIELVERGEPDTTNDYREQYENLARKVVADKNISWPGGPPSEAYRESNPVRTALYDAACEIEKELTPVDPRVEQLAQRFHEAYERLAPKYGYKTRRESSVPWVEVSESNRRLMSAVVAELLDELS